MVNFSSNRSIYPAITCHFERAFSPEQGRRGEIPEALDSVTLQGSLPVGRDGKTRIHILQVFRK